MRKQWIFISGSQSAVIRIIIPPASIREHLTVTDNTDPWSVYIPRIHQIIQLNYVGLFGYVGNGGKICNLTLTDSLIQTTGSNRGNYAGPFAGDAYDLENCHATSTVRISGRNYVGGLAGYLDHSAYRCSSAATVVSEGNTVGGLFGTVQSNSSTAVSECFFSGSVTGVNLVGGIAGSLYNGGTLSDIYCTGSAEATAAAGAAGGITGTFRSGTDPQRICMRKCNGSKCRKCGSKAGVGERTEDPG